MSLADLIVSDVTDVLINTDDFATQILRYVGGNEQGRPTRISAVVTWYPAQTDYDQGRATIRRGAMVVSSTIGVTVKDSFRIGDELVQVDTIGPVLEGAQTVSFVQRLPESKGAKPLHTGDI